MLLRIHQPKKPLYMQWLWLGLILITLGVGITFNLYFEHDRTTAREHDRLSIQAWVIAENTEYQLTSANLALENVRSNLAYWKNDAGQQAVIRHLKAASIIPGIRTMNIVDKEGTITASTRAELIGMNIGSRDYFQEVKQHPNVDMLYVSPPFETVAGTFVINVIRMIEGEEGEFAGIVSATLDPEYFKTLMMSVQYASSMWVALIHSDGMVFLTMPDERENMEGVNLRHPDSFFTRHQNSGKKEQVFTDIMYATKEHGMLALRTIYPANLKMDKPLVVAVNRDSDSIFQSWRQHILVQGIFFGVIVLASTVGLFLHQHRQRKLEKEAAQARTLVDRFSFALDRIPTYIFMKDQQRRYIYANRSTLELFKCSAEDLAGSSDSRFFPPETVARLHETDIRVLLHGEDTAEKVICKGENGHLRIYWEIKTPIYENDKKTSICGLCGIFTDITELELLKEKLEQQARQDYLTGLFNRRFFMEQGHAELIRAQRYHHTLSLLMLDIDNFKKINDRHGHQAGDAVLKRLADVMRKMLRTVDIIGRIGGEEFAVLLPETDTQRATEVAERLREEVACTAVTLEMGMPLYFKVSIGVVSLEGRDADLNTLLNQADKALYQAKENGRNRVCLA
ncbi:diguanylate cyclase [Nitrosomonas sp. Nm34]|uniref:diguanylate cyclase n=1 Tax=Nitrosomonas sp. Nm34 TaxID=1881055 RepID=UPI0008F44749|nr:diguanylate cyclase [Nitrosomonas sp. Nm34]SFI89719.1 PAS domain S-box-containing protein/diguanylate cyclase (GGDEF) domain-containing protein [Nitrosomonas sp. Nm34]